MSPVAYTSTAPLKPRMRTTPPQSGSASAAQKQAALEDLTRRVREQSDRLQRALSPFADRIKTFAESRPVIFTYVAVFVALSCIPVACTVLFILSISALFTGIALFLLCLSILGVIVLAMTFLFPVLFVTATLSAMAVGFLLALFLVHRLYLHVRSATEHQPGLGGFLSGLQSWLEEMMGRVGLGQEYTSNFEGKTINYSPNDYEKETLKSEARDYKEPSDKEQRTYKYPIGQRQRADYHGKVSPTIKHEPRDVRDVFSPESATPNELGDSLSHASGSQIYDADWVSDDANGAGR